MEAKDILIAFETEIKKNKVLFFDKLREHTNDGWKLIYCLQGLTWKNIFFLNLKFIFWFDEKMQKLTHQSITYLYSQDGKFVTTDLQKDISVLIDEILTHIKDEKSNNEINNFAINGTDLFNIELKKNKSNRFIQNLKYQPQGITPSVLTTFTFFLEELELQTELVLKYDNEKWFILKPKDENIDKTITKGVSIDEIYKEVINRIIVDK